MSEIKKPEEFKKEMIGDQEIGRWQRKADTYIDNPSKIKSLLIKAVSKAEHNKHLAIINKLWDKIHLLFSLIKDWLSGSYKDISRSAILLILAGLLYFVSPLDLLPDWLVGLGFVDDVTFLALIINQLDKELLKYKSWKKENSSALENNP